MQSFSLMLKRLVQGWTNTGCLRLLGDQASAIFAMAHNNFSVNYCTLFLTYKDSYQFTCTEHKVLDNSEVQRSVHNCGSSVWHLLHCNPSGAWNFEAGARFLENMVTADWVCVCFWSSVNRFNLFIFWYVVGSKSFRPDVQKPRQMENAVRDI